MPLFSHFRLKATVPAAALLLGAMSALSACATRTSNSQGRLANTTTAPPIIFSVCLSPQGNGGNWGATLAWVSETWLALSYQGQELLAEEGRPVLYKLSCFSGGSSGSGVANVLTSLLHDNKLLLKNIEASGTFGERARQDGLYTPEELETLAHGMRYLTLTTDLNFLESLTFAALTFEEVLFGALGAPVDQINKLVVRAMKEMGVEPRTDGDAGDPKKRPKWWDSQVANPEESILNFAKTAYVASQLSADKNGRWRTGQDGPISLNIAEPIDSLWKEQCVTLDVDSLSKFFRDTVWQRVQRKPDRTQLEKNTLEEFLNTNRHSETYSLNSVSEIASSKRGFSAFRGGSQNLTCDVDECNIDAADYDELLMLSEWQTYHVGCVADQFLAKAREGTKPTWTAGIHFGRHVVDAVDDPPAGKLYPVAEFLAKPPADGVLTVTTGVLGNNRDSLVTKESIRYPRIQTIVLGNATTIERILQSSLLKKHLGDCATGTNKDGCKSKDFLLAAVDKRLYTIQPSVREPALMTELLAPAFLNNRNVKSGRGNYGMGITKLYDLRKVNPNTLANNWPASIEVKENPSITKENDRVHVAVTGGWADRRVSNWMLQYYAESQVRELKTAYRGADVINFTGIFGKPDNIDDYRERVAEHPLLQKKFDIAAVAAHFSDPLPEQRRRFRRNQEESEEPKVSEDALKNQRTYLAQQTAYYRLFAPQALKSHIGAPAIHQEASIYWELPKQIGGDGGLSRIAPGVPGFFMMGSRYLAALAANSVRQGFGESAPTRQTDQDCKRKDIIDGAEVRMQCGRYITSENLPFNLTRHAATARGRLGVVFDPADSRIIRIARDKK